MRHTVVRRASRAVAAGLVASAALFVWLVTPERARDPGPAAAPGAPVPPVAAPASTDSGSAAASFARYCASCHAAEGLRPRIAGADAARRRALETFLRRHGDAPDADDRLLLDWLAGR